MSINARYQLNGDDALESLHVHDYSVRNKFVISVMSYRNTAVVVKNSRLDTASHELIQLLGSIEETLMG